MKVDTSAGPGEYAGFIPAKRLKDCKILVVIEPYNQRNPPEIIGVPFFDCVDQKNGRYLLKEVMKV